ncbi:ectonucleoside triphosphate diphosphohydrolase 1 [Microcaecilia unicolor]|uniref:Ectonucleoside triphosphate diphosphohydrolase 1 n=1 Tax=Microcaecilia unicolor TaxID=1415580 RepID=A0A6P7Y6P7_9AMPH|nr:ectonucleoside triphosphate diphosphohydrolase 1 [Microcaecilia unicolor]
MEEAKGPKQKISWSKRVLIVLGFLFILGIVALITVAVVQNKHLPENTKYGIVLDAGSSHTSVYVYSWPAEKENDTGIVQQVEVCKVDGPGISSYSNDVEKAGLSLQNCMNTAKKVIPKNKHKDTPVYLGATAGMRLLSLNNSEIAEKVLLSVEKTLRLYPFDFQSCRIITGQEEGAYGWISINYMLGNFNQRSSWMLFEQASVTTGALDLGGASTQITFVPKNNIDESPDNFLLFRLYGNTYNVYTHSFLCYGKDQALRVRLASDIKVARSTTLQNPCFNVGYVKNISADDLYSSPCTASYKLFLGSSILVTGSGDYQQCQQNMQDMFDKADCFYSRCSFNGIFQPELSGEFGAFSAFYFVMNFLNLTSGSDLSKMKETMKEFCSTPWETVKENFPDIKEKYLSEYCFSGTYILTLLELGYGFNSENWGNLYFFRKIKGSDAVWTLGYMLNLTNMIPAELPLSPPLSHASYVGLMVLFSFVSASVVLIGWLYFWKPRCLQKGII